MFLYLLFTIPYFASGDVLPNLSASPCKITDTACLENVANTLMPLFMAENPEIGVESSDPLLVEKNEADLPMIKCTFFNVIVTGFKECSVSNLQLAEDLTKVHCDLTCPKLTMTGQYDIAGQLIVLPVEGNGDFTLTTGKYFVTVDSELKIKQGEDGKRHLSIKNFKLKIDAMEPLTYKFDNLFNGQKDLSDAVHKFANENWKEVADLMQEPIWYGNMKKLISNINKYLKHIPINDVLSQ